MISLLLVASNIFAQQGPSIRLDGPLKIYAIPIGNGDRGVVDSGVTISNGILTVDTLHVTNLLSAPGPVYLPDLTVSDIEATNSITLGGVTRTQWIDPTNGMDQIEADARYVSNNNGTATNLTSINSFVVTGNPVISGADAGLFAGEYRYAFGFSDYEKVLGAVYTNANGKMLCYDYYGNQSPFPAPEYQLRDDVYSVAYSSTNKTDWVDNVLTPYDITMIGEIVLSNRIDGSLTIHGGLSAGGGTAVAPFSTAFGQASRSLGNSSFSAGNSVTANGTASAAFGMNSVANGLGSVAFGDGSATYYDFASAFGYRCVASNYYATAIGSEALALGAASVAIGGRATATADSSAAFGYNTTASGDASAAFGFESVASGNYSAAFGAGTTAGGYASAAFGEDCEAYGGVSLAFGSGSIASNDYAVAIGDECLASGYAALAFGRKSKATHSGAFVFNGTGGNTNFVSTTNDTFNVRATNGVYITTSANKGININQGSGYKAGITTNLVYEGTNRLNIVGGIIVGVNQ